MSATDSRDGDGGDDSWLCSPPRSPLAMVFTAWHTFADPPDPPSAHCPPIHPSTHPPKWPLLNQPAHFLPRTREILLAKVLRKVCFNARFAEFRMPPAVDIIFRPATPTIRLAPLIYALGWQHCRIFRISFCRQRCKKFLAACELSGVMWGPESHERAESNECVLSNIIIVKMISESQVEQMQGA